MVDLVSDLAGVNKNEVRKRALHLREVGLLPKGLRGRGAPNVEAIHAARLIVAMLSDHPQIRAVEDWQELEGLTWRALIEHAPNSEPIFQSPWSYPGAFGHAVEQFLIWQETAVNGLEWFPYVTS
jgi:hypothetical protein